MTITATYGETIEINAPIESVYDYRLDFVKLATYNSHVTNISRTVDGEGGVGKGAEYVFDLALPGWEAGMKAFLKVIDTDRPNTIVTDTGTDALAGREVNTFEQLPNGAVRFTIQFSIDLPDEAKDGVEMIEKSGRDEYKIEQAAIKKTLEG